MKIETYVLEIIEGKRKNFFVSWLLCFLSHGYRMGVIFRNWYYDKIYSPKRTGAKVISVGNIVAGGSGKTPMVSFLAKKMEDSHKIAILTRGYRSLVEKETRPQRITRDNEILCGDEPVWLAKTLPFTEVWVGKDRIRSAKEAVKNQASLLILDDGMQHRKLHRDIEIVMMDKNDLFGHGYFIPRGLLRDEPKRLAKADVIVVHPLEEGSEYKIVEARLRHFTKAKIVAAKMVLKDAEPFRGKKVGVFCGIAKPRRFLHALEKEGIEIVASLFTQDHILPCKDELACFAKECLDKGASVMLCTEKDAVKMDDTKFVLPIVQVAAELVVTKGEEHLDKILQSLKR